MLEKILSTLITIIVSGSFGYLVSFVKNTKKREKAQNNALLTILQNSLTNIYYVYNEVREIPDYALKNWVNLLTAYEDLGGDDYIHELDKRIKTMKVVVTGIIK